MSEYDSITSLDELFAVAKKEFNKARAGELHESRKGRRVHDKDDAPAPPAELFQRPENWRRTRGIALIHAETETLLGNFSEYLHISVAGARKLIREETPIAIAATERVSGDWWITRKEEVVAAESWHRTALAVIDLALPSLLVHSPATPVKVLISYGGIARVELEVETQFVQTEGAEQLLTLPAGVNVLPVMSHDSKVAVKAQVLE